MNNKIISLLLMVLAFVPQNVFANSPRQEMDNTLNQLVEIVERLPGDANKEERRTQMRSVIEPKFDFTEMSKRSLGTHWKEINTEQQNEFVTIFSRLLANTYLGKIDMIERGMIEITDDRVHEDKSMIKTMVNFKGDKFGLDYRLLQKDGKWKVYDVVIENIGLVANYRNEFAGVIRKEKFSGLIEKLKEKAGS